MINIMKNEKLPEIIISVVILLVFFILLLFLHSIPTVINIQSSGFEPNNTGIYPGTVIRVNNDNKIHRIISDSALFDSGNLRPGENYTYDFSGHETGYYNYHDLINTSQKGRIEVEMVTQ